MNKILILGLLIVTSQNVQALINSALSVEQFSNHFHFTVSIQNNTKQLADFSLSPQAKNLKLAGLVAKKSTPAGQHFFLGPDAIGQVEYDIAYLPEQHYYLTSEEAWTPVLNQSSAELAQVFSLQAKMLPGFQLMSSATGQNQDELDLAICKCVKYTSADQRLNVILFKEEPELAKTILSHLQTYLQKFEASYGPYPYDQFTVVESDQEIGYAFPKMTWIGSQLLHFPFILKTSLPHELLHSWWGNGVFVDYAQGNWCEGLTSFGADYQLLSEAEKKLYRLRAITDYMDYAQTTKELPLSQFLSRGEDKSLAALGYSKAMMVFLMAEARVGPVAFNQALKQFYLQYRFRRASYDDFFRILSEGSGVSFKNFVNFWVYSPGILGKNFIQGQLSSAQELTWTGDMNTLSKLPGMPLAVNLHFADQTLKPLELRVRDDGHGLVTNTFALEKSPLAYSFDDEFNLFRELDDAEKPVGFAQALAATQINLRSSQADFRAAVQSVLPHAIVNISTSPLDFSQQQILLMTEDEALRNLAVANALIAKKVSFQPEQFSLQGASYSRLDHSLIVGIKINKAVIFVFALGKAQSSLRWLQRWSHYGGKNFLILNPTGADTQGIWLDPYLRRLFR